MHSMPQTNSSQSNLLLSGFTQFGAVLDNSNRSFQFMLFNRFCIPASYSGDPLFEKFEEMIIELNRHKGNHPHSATYVRLTVMTVPIIVVITKFDLYVASLQRRSGTETKISYQSAEDNFKKEFDLTFDKKSMSEGQIPYALVSSMFLSRLHRLY